MSIIDPPSCNLPKLVRSQLLGDLQELIEDKEYEIELMRAQIQKFEAMVAQIHAQIKEAEIHVRH
jgi:hypothetical protein